MTYAEVCDYLFALRRFEHDTSAYKPGLDTIRALLEAMDRPHEAFESVHVAGTNGKGSTASMVAAIGTASGRRIGLHTSPHLFDFTERMRLDGEPAPHPWIVEAVHRYRPVFDELGSSFFEASIALSFLYFAEQQVDLAVIEVGLGGRLDATNVIRPRLTLITSIGFDHTAQLGETLPEIAHEKAGIIKPGIPLFTSATQPEVIEVLEAMAARQHSPISVMGSAFDAVIVETSALGLTLDVRTPEREIGHLEVGLPGEHQRSNAALAVAAADFLFEGLSEQALRTGLQQVQTLSGLRGRCEVLQPEPLIIADVAHNAEGLSSTLRFLDTIRHSPPGRLFVLFGVMRDKPIGVMIQHLSAAEATVLPLAAETPRALPLSELRRRLTACHIPLVDIRSVADGVAWFLHQAQPSDALLVTGSHHIVAGLPRRFYSYRPD